MSDALRSTKMIGELLKMPNHASTLWRTYDFGKWEFDDYVATIPAREHVLVLDDGTFENDVYVIRKVLYKDMVGYIRLGSW